MENKELAREIFALTGPRDNVQKAYHCMTRLRLELKQEPDLEKLKQLPGVLGINISGTELQIVLGPKKVGPVTDAFMELLESAPAEKNPEEKNSEKENKKISPETFSVGDGKALHAAVRQKNATPGKLFLKKIAGIFVPLIPGFIGCGLLTGLCNFLLRVHPALAQHFLFQVLAAAGGTVFWGMNLFVGWNTAKEFGGSPVLGGALGALITHPGINLVIYGEKVVPGRGGIAAVLLVAALGALLEKRLHKIIPASLDLFLTPFFTLAIMAFGTFFVLQPVGGFLADAIGYGATEAVEKGGAFTGAVLGGTFLPLVMLGIHQGLTPIHAELIHTFGYTVLLPILAMAGGGQVGAGAAVYVKTKNPRIKNVVASALPAGLLGVGEPLIYGVTLPLGKPFIGACIGGAAGGAVQAFGKVGASALGISGLPLAASTTNIPLYLIGLLVSYGVGFAATWFIGFDDPGEA